MLCCRGAQSGGSRKSGSCFVEGFEVGFVKFPFCVFGDEEEFTLPLHNDSAAEHFHNLGFRVVGLETRHESTMVEACRAGFPRTDTKNTKDSGNADSDYGRHTDFSEKELKVCLHGKGYGFTVCFTLIINLALK